MKVIYIKDNLKQKSGHLMHFRVRKSKSMIKFCLSCFEYIPIVVGARIFLKYDDLE